MTHCVSICEHILVWIAFQQYLYGTQARHLSYNDFINKELILFSNSDNERSIPSLVDGLYQLLLPTFIFRMCNNSRDTAMFTCVQVVFLQSFIASPSDGGGGVCPCVWFPGLKPGQRKVLFTCLKRNDKREVKVAQLAGSVAEMSAYHHGEVHVAPYQKE